MRLTGLVRALVAEGATPGMILAAVEAMEREWTAADAAADGLADARAQARREAARERQRVSRARRQTDDGAAVSDDLFGGRGEAEGGADGMVRAMSRHVPVTPVTVTERDCHTMSHDVTVTGCDTPPSPPLSPPDPQTLPPYIPPGLLLQQQPRAADEGRQDARRSRTDLDAIEARCREAAGVVDSPSPGFVVLAPLLGLLDAGYDLDGDILPVLRARRGRGRPQGWAYFVEAIREARAKRAGVAGLPAASAAVVSVTPIDRRDFRSVMAANGFRPVAEHYDILCRAWYQDGRWPIDRGPKPGEAGGFVPIEHAEDWLARHPECREAVA
ncbi:hypothetical protein [Prosthecomicrobium hirschii]|uniref:hypothetical protein n=1 Tax=Prosthecodimorpha hirschii TaxID=665126 RepID=UPI002220721C|nr:hypothetical protein [Prosthecomicrobium hirschii]MCW1839452.1 hypothetical protein [Prosthecomicrobium hirschii]